MAYEHLQLGGPVDGVLRITLDRPEHLNAVDATLHRELSQVWLDVGARADVRSVLVTGAGTAFCAGGDLGWIEGFRGDFDGVHRAWEEAGALVRNMLACPVPIVSAINGPAVGAGLAVALVADISIIAEDVRITDGHLRLGVAPGDHAVLLWPLLCGMAKAKYYLLTADFLDGREAERIGLVSRAVPRDQLMTTAGDVAARLAAGPQHAVRWTKRALNGWFQAAAPQFETALALEMLGFFDPDSAEGVRALREKRRPVFPSALGTSPDRPAPSPVDEG